MKGRGSLASSQPNSTLLFSGLFSFFAFGAMLVGAPSFLGPNKCTSCHDHDKQKQWFDKDTHAKALEQLEDPKSKKYLAAIGLTDAYNLQGACVACHATVFNKDANAGVACETCHGAGSDYLEPHQEKGAYDKARSLGMIDTRGNYPRWARLCLDCHIVTDRKLTAAGHSSGADFEVAAKSQKIVHWSATYDYAKLADAGGAGARARPGGGAVPKGEPTPAATALPATTTGPPRSTPVTKAPPRSSPTPVPVASARPTVAARATMPLGGVRSYRVQIEAGEIKTSGAGLGTNAESSGRSPRKPDYGSETKAEPSAAACPVAHR